MFKDKNISNGMKILMLSSYLPYPLTDGGNIRLYNLLKNLSKKHDITLICEKRSHQTQKDIDEINKICKKIITINRPKVWSTKNIVKTALSINPLLITSHTNKEMTEIIKQELLENKFDLIHVETFYVMQNLPKVGIPVVLVEHNIEFKVYERYLKRSPFFLRPAMYLDILKLRKKEKEAWRKADKLVAVSPSEQKEMGESAELVPNGVDIEKFKLKNKEFDKKEKKILFIGNFKWIQNRDSLAYIIRNIWPGITKKNPNLKLWVVGKNIPEKLKNLQNETISFDENAPEDTQLIFQEADLLLSPIRIGGGTNFKILEAMASGTPVITSALGNEGIGAKNGEEIIICSKPDEFVNKTLLVLSDKYLYEKLSRKARIFVEKNFDWKNITNKLEEIYQSLVKI